MSVKPIPEGYSTVTPYLTVNDASGAIEFYKKALGASERMRMPAPDGKVIHAELLIGGSVVMLSEEIPQMGGQSPLTLGGSPVAIHLYVEDVDACVSRAVDAGATVTHPVQDQFYGDRTCGLKDPYGHKWHVATHIEDVPFEEMDRRMTAFMSKKPA